MGQIVLRSTINSDENPRPATGTVLGSKELIDVSSHSPGRSKADLFAFSVSTSAYTALDQMGSLLEITNAARESGGGGFISGLELINNSNLQKSIYINIFSGSVTLASDNAAYSLSASDRLKSIGKWLVPSGRFLVDGGGTIATIPIGKHYKCDGTSLYVAAQAYEAMTFTNSAHLQIRLFLDRD